MLRLTSIDNISGRGYTLAPTPPGVEVVYRNPAESFRLLKSGKCDGGLLPVAGLPELAEDFDVLGGYGIACAGRVHSVQLFSHFPIAELFEMERPIHVTADSKTSRALVRVLGELEYGVSVTLTDNPAAAEAIVLIGDEAVEEWSKTLPWEYTCDLSEWWHDATGLPFVFARWVVRKSMPDSGRAAICEWLETCARASVTISGIRRLMDSGLASMTSEDFARSYYKNLHIKLDEQDAAGQRLFLEMMEGKVQCQKGA